MSNLSIENVINVSVSQVGQGVGEYNTSNLAVFTQEPYAVSFGTDGYKIYLEPSDVGVDFGTDSDTYKKALAIFSQQPNILANNGYLVVIPLIVEEQIIDFDAVPDGGSIIVAYLGNNSAAINHNDTLSQVQTKIRAIAGLSEVVVTGSFASGFTIKFHGLYGNIAAMTYSSNTLVNGMTPIVVTVTEDVAGEKLEEAIVRTDGLVQYFGLMVTQILGAAELLTCGAVIQPLNKIGFFGSSTVTDLDVGDKFDDVKSAGLYKTRCLFYGGSSDQEVFVMVASYAGRALSTNFNGNNTTQTMHLKDLTGVLPDPVMTQTLLTKAQNAGVDCYISIQGVPKVFTSGENRFFDDVYNLEWFVGALQVAGFNVLAQTGTKIAQTEQGVDTLKSAYRNVCERAISNQFMAPGKWTSPNTFGTQEDFYNNISERGYYIYSSPVALQAPSERAARNSPLIQLAVKYAGAIHKSNIVVSINL
jgi:hypothetical protein